MPICSVCSIDKEQSLFSRDKKSKTGYSYRCRECRSSYGKQYQKQYSSKLKEIAHQYYLENRERIIEKTVTWRTENPEKAKKHLVTYYENNKEECYIRNSTWKKANSHKVCAQTQKRNSSKMNRTPSWTTDVDLFILEEAYHLAKLRTSSTGIEWQVDHIFPLQGKLVSGLHISNNVQVVPAVWNQKKNNSFDPMYPDKQFYFGVQDGFFD